MQRRESWFEEVVLEASQPETDIGSQIEEEDE